MKFIDFKIFCEDVSCSKLWLLYECSKVSPNQWQIYKILNFIQFQNPGNQFWFLTIVWSLMSQRLIEKFHWNILGCKVKPTHFHSSRFHILVLWLLSDFVILVSLLVAENLPQHSPVVILINVTLIIGVICTYPLQIFPVVEILENMIFAEGLDCIFSLTVKLKSKVKLQKLMITSENSVLFIIF